MKRILENIIIDKELYKTDGILSVLFLFIYTIEHYWSLKIIPLNSYYIYISVAHEAVWFFLLYALIKKRKQGLKSIGIYIEALPLMMIAIVTFSATAYSIFKDDFEIMGRWFFYLLAVGGMEEIIFRGYLYPRIQKLTHNHLITILITGILFGAMHHIAPMAWNGEPLIGVLNVIGGGIVGNLIFLFVYARTGNLLNAIILHATLDYSNNMPFAAMMGIGYTIIVLLFNDKLKRFFSLARNKKE